MANAKDLVEVIKPPEVLTLDTIAGLRINSPTIDQYVNLLVYGEPGVGKTRLAGSACVVPEMAPVLLLDFEGGTLSLARDYGAVNVVRVQSWQKVADLYNQLYDKNPFKTIVLDSLSETQKFAMGQIMQDVLAKDSSRDPDVPSVREWGKSSEQIRRLVRALRDLPCNTIFTALTSEDKDERTGTMKTRPGLPGKLKGEIAGFVDIVLYLYKKEIRAQGEITVHTLGLTEGTERQVAKDRSGTLPTLMQAPTMKDIYDYIQGVKTK
jgi:hypothetical protein